jgi:hypothetical protein
MTTLTLSVPEELKNSMDAFPEMNWSAVARAAIQERIEMLHKFKEFTRESKMTEKDALTLGKKVNKKAATKYK